MSLQEFVHSAKATIFAIGLSAGGYLSYLYDLIPPDINKLAALLGIPLTIIFTIINGRALVNDRRGAALKKQAQDLKKAREEWEKEVKQQKLIERQNSEYFALKISGPKGQ